MAAKKRKVKPSRKSASKQKQARKQKPVVRSTKVPVRRSTFKPSKVTPNSARSFIRGATLPPPRLRRDATEPPTPLNLADTAFQQGKDQAAVVGSAVVSFVKGVTIERREAIVNSSLLAQLVAKRAVPDATDIDAWYRVYFDTLAHVGWVVQDLVFKEYNEESESFDAHQAILTVITALLGQAPAALALVKTTLEALQSMNQNSPWITIFNRESQSARVARFQVSLAEQDDDGQFMVHTMAFALKAGTTITQVLFFKARSSEAHLRYHSGDVTINAAVLEAVNPDLRAKLAAHARDFISTLPDL